MMVALTYTVDNGGCRQLQAGRGEADFTSTRTVSEPERLPCPRCAQPAAAEALICPHCRTGLATDVVATAPVTDARERYRVARALAAQGPPVLALGPLRQALAFPEAVVARAASRAAAARLIATLRQTHGLHAVARLSAARAPAAMPDDAPDAASRPRTSAGVKAAAVLAVLAVGAATGFVGRWAIRTVARGAALSPAGLARLATHVGASRAQLAGPGMPGGAGVVVAPGLVLALAQPGAATTAIVQVAGAQRSGAIVNTDADAGFALVRIGGGGPPPLPLADATAIRDGDVVVVVHPSGRGAAAMTASVTNADAAHDGVSLLQIEAELAEAAKGSPVLDADGRLVGLVGGSREGARIAWVVPINYAFAWLPWTVPHDGAAWARRVAARADAAEARERVFAAVRSGPVLLHARHDGVDQYGALQEIVVERFGVLIAAPVSARTAPPALRLKVGPCELVAAVDWWPDGVRRVAGRPAALQAFERWAADHGVGAGTIVGEASVPLDRRRCPTQGAREASLLLAGALVNTVAIDAP